MWYVLVLFNKLFIYVFTWATIITLSFTDLNIIIDLYYYYYLYYLGMGLITETTQKG